MKRTQDTVSNSNHDLPMIALSTVIVVSAVRGVYYSEEYYTVHILSALCLLICLFMSKQRKIVLASSILDYILLAFTFLYIINVTWAVQKQWALEEALKYINYFLIYWLAAKAINDRQRHNIMKIFMAIGVVFSLMATFDYLGLIPIEGAVQGGRFTATLKYTNALGSYLLASIVLAHFGINERKYGWLFSLSVYVMIIAFIGTFSRANYLLALPVFIGMYIAYPVDKKRAIINSILLLLSGISVSMIIFGNYALYLKIFMFILGLITAGISGKRRAVLTGIVILLTAITLVCPYMFAPDKETVPENRAVTRVQEIDFEESSLQLRLIFYKDALELIKESPLLGEGGGAWRALYPSKTSFLYYTKFPHSYPLRIGIEAGLIGLGLFLAMLIYVCITTIRYGKKENRVLGFALAAIFLHSFVDFDLSIGFLSITAWILLSVFGNSIKGMRLKDFSINKWVLIVFTGAFFAASSGLLLSSQFADLEDEVSYNDAAGRLSKAVTAAPFNSQNYGTLANVNYKAFQLSGETKYLQLSLSEIDKAIKYDQANYNWYLDKALYLAEKGEKDLAQEVIKENYALLPKYQNETYARTAYILRIIAQGYLENKELGAGKLALEEILQLWLKAREEIAAVPQEYFPWWREEEIVTEYDPFLLEVINAYDYLGEKEKAKALMEYLSEETKTQHQWLQEI